MEEVILVYFPPRGNKVSGRLLRNLLFMQNMLNAQTLVPPIYLWNEISIPDALQSWFDV